MAAPAPNAYLRTKVMTASPSELRLMLIDGAIRFAEQARTGLDAGDHEQVFEGASRCQSILMELMTSLRPEQAPELCERLSALYTYLYQRMVVAITDRSLEAVEEVLGLLRYERETWVLLMQQIGDGAADGGGSGRGMAVQA